MATKSILGVLLIGIIATVVDAQVNQWQQTQNGGWNFGAMNGLNRFSGMWGQAENDRYCTCIGKNTNQDEMRLTFTDTNDQQQAWWMRNQWNRRGIKLDASIRVAGQSTTTGQFRLVLTENGRVEDGCYSAALGKIVDTFQNPNTWMQMRRPQNSETGILGQAFMLAPNNGQQWSGDIEGFENLEQLLGRGVGLCHANNIANGMCQYIIPLCCKVGWDSQPATQPIQGNFNQFGQQVGTVVGQQMNPMMGMNTNQPTNTMGGISGTGAGTGGMPMF